MSIDAPFLDDFRQTLNDAARQMREISDARASEPRGPGKWSRKEVVGHMIDSACNNHSRFVRAQTMDDLMFSGYDGDAWVQVQHYNGRPWAELVGLWKAYNDQIVHVMATADPESLELSRVHHTLDKIAFQVVRPDEPTTLTFLMEDYVAHLKHHLRQIWATPTPV